MFEEIIFTPLDISRLDLDRQKIIEFCDKRKYRDMDWMRTDIKKYSEPLNEDFKSLFPNAELILRSLPFEDFDNSLHIHFYDQVVTNRPHQDPITKLQNSCDLGPASYKNFVIRDKIDTFYLLPNSTNQDVIQYDNRPVTYLNPVFPLMPDDTNWFAINNHKGYHGSFLAPPEYRKITMFFVGPVNRNKHFELINRSIEKYKDYIIYN